MKYSFGKWMMWSLVLQFFALVSLSVAGDQVNVPHDFTAGTTAKAAEVNANFSAIEAAVNDNDVRIANNTGEAADIAAVNATIQARLSPVVLDGNDNEIGLLVNIDDDGAFVDVISEQGYILDNLSLALGTANNFPSSLSFVSSDCTGPGLTGNIPAGWVGAARDEAGVIRMYYASKDSLPIVSSTIASVTSPIGCQVVENFVESNSWPTLPNDPVITGISTDTYQLPIKIDVF